MFGVKFIFFVVYGAFDVLCGCEFRVKPMFLFGATIFYEKKKKNIAILSWIILITQATFSDGPK